jgi:hypothetical protein
VTPRRLVQAAACQNIFAASCNPQRELDHAESQSALMERFIRAILTISVLSCAAVPRANTQAHGSPACCSA